VKSSTIDSSRLSFPRKRGMAARARARRREAQPAFSTLFKGRRLRDLKMAKAKKTVVRGEKIPAFGRELVVVRTGRFDPKEIHQAIRRSPIHGY
jgi:hypothetical protein